MNGSMRPTRAIISSVEGCLAGDSAHVNNSVGGLGLNGGIHDAIELAHSLPQVITKQAGDDLLDSYTRRRRTLNIEFVQEQTINNKKRLEERDPKARQAVSMNCEPLRMSPLGRKSSCFAPPLSPACARRKTWNKDKWFE
jgi:3-(3-hydroxy-phenyl)propionate hydroxylase